MCFSHIKVGIKINFATQYDNYFHNITMLPAVISKAPMMTFVLTGSFSSKKASSMVITTLSLSIGATRETSPVCNALK